jgi:branched-chain amino acid transport system permease protein
LTPSSSRKRSARPSARGPESRVDAVSWGIVAVALLLLVFAPLIFTDFFVGVILTKALWLGIAAASLIFLASYAGMVSLGQVGLYAIAGMMFANLVAADGGLDAAWNPWVAVIAALLIATLAGLLFGAVAARSVGIYFLMITLALGVLVYYFFAQVTQLSGFGGVNSPELPALIGNPGADPVPLFYVTLAASVLVFLGIRYLVRTPFGLAMQGLRDEPDRMRALGFNVALHRTLAFAAGAFIAAVAGILSVWYNQRISPGSISLGQTIDILVIAVIGGLYRLEGAWVGAIFFALLDNYSREYTPDVGEILGPERFNTLIGIIFLVIVLVSPGGLVGIWEKAKERMGPSPGGRRSRAGPVGGDEPPPPVQQPLGPGRAA